MDKLTINDIRNFTDTELCNYLQKVWKAGFMTAQLKNNSSKCPNFYAELVEN